MNRTIIFAAAVAVASFAVGQASAASSSYAESPTDYYHLYVSGVGDPQATDASTTGSIGVQGSASYAESPRDYYQLYVNGVGDLGGANTDDATTGSIGDEPRVDVEGFCEGEGKELAARLYVGFCHLANETSLPVDLVVTGSTARNVAIPPVGVAPFVEAPAAEFDQY